MITRKKNGYFFNIITLFLIFIILILSSNCAVVYLGDLESYNKVDENNQPQPQPQIAAITKDITSFIFGTSKNGSVLSVDAIGIIGTDTIDLTVPFGTSLASLVPTIDITGSSISPESNVAQTFTDGVGSIYTVTGSDGSTKDYTVTVHVAASSAKDIVNFVFTAALNAGLPNDLTGVITGTNIDIHAPVGTDITNLIPTIGITGVSINPASNTPHAFSDGTGVIYTVTAADASTQAYTVTVYKPPLPGNGGMLTFSGVTKTSITVDWTKATDDHTPQADLQYLVYYSASNNIDTIANIEANGTPVDTYTTDINTKLITGLSGTSTYYFNVIVIDQNNNKTAYNMNNQATTDNIQPIAGNSGLLSFSGVTTNSITVTWTKATDNITPLANLQYLVYYSENSSSVNTVTSMENTGTHFGSYSTDINSITVTGLTDAATYYFNVIVKDEAGNKTAYSKNSQTTKDGTPPEVKFGDINTLAVGSNTVMPYWERATDNATPQVNLQYLVYYSTSNNIDTVANIEANGKAHGSYKAYPPAGLCYTTITGLTDGTTYYFNVIVKDGAGNKAAYTMMQVETSDGTPPVEGNSGQLTFTSVSDTSITVNWTKATDNVTAQANLQYLVYRSTNSNINNIANAETNGTPIGSYTADINEVTVTGLNKLKCYYFNVIVQDQAGNQTAYRMNSTLTLPNIPSISATPTVASLTPASSFGTPNGLCNDGINLYVSDRANHTVSKVDISTGTITLIAGLSGASGSSDGNGTSARFNSPYGICTDGINLYVSDTGNKSVRKIVIATGDVTTIATGFNNLYGITTDGTNVYVADAFDRKILKVAITNGTKTVIAGSGAQGSSDGIGTAASFWGPYGICSDGTNLYACDYGKKSIRKINIETSEVTTLATLPNSCMHICTDGTYLYISEYWTSIYKLNISTGSLVATFSTGGFSTTQVQGVTTDGIKIYFVDTINKNIRSLK